LKLSSHFLWRTAFKYNPKIAASVYQGGTKFANKLTGARRIKTRECFNKLCNDTQEKVMIIGGGVEREGIRMKDCTSACQTTPQQIGGTPRRSACAVRLKSRKQLAHNLV
jgi:hypothetical protein